MYAACSPISSKQSSHEEGKKSAIPPTPFLRGRLQRPKPNIGRALGRREIQSAEKNDATAAISRDEKSKEQKSEPTTTTSIAVSHWTVFELSSSKDILKSKYAVSIIFFLNI